MKITTAQFSQWPGVPVDLLCANDGGGVTGGGGAVEVHLAHAEGGGVQQVLRLVDKGLNNITQVLGQLPGLKDAHPVLLEH